MAHISCNLLACGPEIPSHRELTCCSVFVWPSAIVCKRTISPDLRAQCREQQRIMKTKKLAEETEREMGERTNRAYRDGDEEKYFHWNAPDIWYDMVLHLIFLFVGSRVLLREYNIQHARSHHEWIEKWFHFLVSLPLETYPPYTRTQTHTRALVLCDVVRCTVGWSLLIADISCEFVCSRWHGNKTVASSPWNDMLSHTLQLLPWDFRKMMEKRKNVWHDICKS